MSRKRKTTDVDDGVDASVLDMPLPDNGETPDDQNGTTKVRSTFYHLCEIGPDGNPTRYLNEYATLNRLQKDVDAMKRMGLAGAGRFAVIKGKRIRVEGIADVF